MLGTASNLPGFGFFDSLVLGRFLFLHLFKFASLHTTFSSIILQHPYLENQISLQNCYRLVHCPHNTMTILNGKNSVDSKSSLSGQAPLEAVLFDVDGTLCDSDPLHHYAFREMLQEIGFNGGVPISEDFFIQNIAGKHNDDIALSLFPDDLQRGLKFCDDKEAMFRKLATEQLKPVSGIYKVKNWIEDHGLKRAAVTNAPRPNAELMISILGLSDFFDALIIGSECEHAKPFPDPYLKALEVLNVSKDHTFIFEDSVSGIKAGVAAGIPVVGITTRNPENLLMEAKPALLIKNYDDPKLWEALEELDK